MPRSLRSSVKRIRKERQHNMQSIKNLVPILSTDHQPADKILCKREFLAILQLMPVECNDKANGLNNNLWCDTLEHHLLKRDINKSKYGSHYACILLHTVDDNQDVMFILKRC